MVADTTTIHHMGAATLNKLPAEEEITAPMDLSISLNNLYDQDATVSDSIVEFDDGRIIKPFPLYIPLAKSPS